MTAPSSTLRQTLFLFAALSFETLVSAQSGSSSVAILAAIDVSASATATSVENISRTSHGPTRKDASTYELTVNANAHRQMAPGVQLNGGIDATFLQEPKFDRNNRSQFAARVGLQRKFGLGPLAPIIHLDAAYTYNAARFPGDRGGGAEATVRVSKRLTSSLRVAAEGQWQERFARSATFDNQQRTAGLEAAWDVTEKWRLTGNVTWLEGRLVTNAAPAIWAQAIGGALVPSIARYYNSIPSEITQLYGPNWISYSPEVTANLSSLALAYTLSERTLIEARFGSAYVINEVDVRYPSKSWGLSLVHQF